ncbi:NYN domain-containing protein [Acaryochloris sp. 'Moss Beach']|uniref:NYN domain-containing protein n=1 Tax=Acaryochloris TaxID=155977 RepID=UPI001BAF60E4|nr:MULTISPECIES: NYN domain-containing protein [Acaryochloris]QUY42904.1 NYN domain-containing protein [Acaryochloris marina S15]UJB67788.1 NYN domain-containing protein [Acaryochloris sp. 'Moss Beach']
MVQLSKQGLILGLGPLAFAIAFGVTYLSDRDTRRASVTGLAALSATYATGLIATEDRRRAALASASHLQIQMPLQTSSPPVPSTPVSKSAPSEVAVFWDYENVKIAAQGIQAPLAESLVDYSQSQGHTRLKIVYSNWRREKESLVQALYSLGFEPIHVSTGKENAVDVKLTVDCLNTAYQYPDVGHFIIVTGDRDFVPLVNALKTLKKRVTLIGRAEVASNQLLLSADEFIDLEKLDTEETEETTPTKRLTQSISYEDAVACLLAAINLARDQGKSTRFGAVDRLMRANVKYAYAGVASITRPDAASFTNFSAFVDAAATAGQVQIKTLAGFKELFLPEEDPEAESEFSSQDSGPLTREQWKIILDQVQSAFKETDPEHNSYGRFMSLFFYVRLAKKDGRLPHSNERLKQSLSRLVDQGILMEQANRSFRVGENWEDKVEGWLDQLVQTEGDS